MRTWIDHALLPLCRLVVVVVVVKWFSWHTLGPLVSTGHHLNATAYLSIVSDHVHVHDHVPIL